MLRSLLKASAECSATGEMATAVLPDYPSNVSVNQLHPWAEARHSSWLARLTYHLDQLAHSLIILGPVARADHRM
jgi:hypothetical protein